ncbi:MAG: helix-turn-helix domain-containing protein [Deltaproteobacteria bacterium]|jgi:transcriptional regulator with XRE-family HTH domain|nr:helix-turn-helix domain-containing protein [Deltaproteobacteria bacterium]
MEKDFFERLSGRRKEVGFSQIDVGEALGTSSKTVSGYETGRREPTLETLARLADIYSCTADWLLGRENKPPAVPAVPGWFKPLLEDVCRIKSGSGRKALKAVVTTMAAKG